MTKNELIESNSIAEAGRLEAEEALRVLLKDAILADAEVVIVDDSWTVTNYPELFRMLSRLGLLTE